MTPKPAVCMVGNVLGTGGVFISELPDGFTLTDAVADKLRAVITDSMAMSRISRLYDENAFEAFWKAYPRKVAKVLAAKAWKKLNPPDSLVRSIMFALEMQKRTEQWQKDGGQFVPHPATWLNQQRWLDEIGPAAPVAPDASKERARSVDVIKQREAMLRGQRA
jgi:hypothetical protein